MRETSFRESILENVDFSNAFVKEAQ
ncbi:hypothetical protein IW492_10695 [Enterococcus sp. BWB1-3]|nr:hypothetical protein [Enterococcus sp. BWB1-3]MCB5952834.1 hypothetical protein [Enterococcus sp. BWT-B8]MCB5953839.1 hypothetical protein [Enterococcus sp. CWB-B31]